MAHSRQAPLSWKALMLLSGRQLPLVTVANRPGRGLFVPN